jgi:hypothetical protein
MNADRAQQLALREMSRFGLLKRGWTFVFSNSRRALGMCIPRNRVINLSLYYLDKVSEVETHDTILHEVAHALEAVRHGTAGHGPVWKSIAREVGAKPVARCKVKIHHPYPFVVKYEDKIVRGFWKLPRNINERLQTMTMKGRPETAGKLKLYRVTYAEQGVSQ